MRFFKNPPMNSIRKRFLWRPARVMLLRGKYFATGEPDIPYVAGWVNSGYPVPLSSMNGRARSMRTHLFLGGMVTPVEHQTYNEIDCWIWLDWVLEIYNYTHGANGKTVGIWTPAQMPKQWNLWNEYDA